MLVHTDGVYVTWVSMTDLQKSLDFQNLCHLATTKIKVTAKQNIVIKIKLENIKEK